VDSLRECMGSLGIFVFSVGIYCGYVCADCDYLRVHLACVGIGVFTGYLCVH
jgi:hypothetical protein